MLILVTGATGKVGANLIANMLQDSQWNKARIRALCHNRVPPKHDRVEISRGDIADRAAVENAMAGVTHVVHLATCKEVPETVMDVTVKGLFWLLEAFRQSPVARQFILIGGDAGIGHFFYEHDGPVTESQPHMAYPGCYALSKVLEEVMLTQFGIQYGINACCLRAPWIMEKDDFRFTLSFGDDVFGGPDWKTLVSPETAARCRAEGTVPLLRDAHGRPLKRNFVHVEDLTRAILLALDNPVARGRLYNISMDEPVDYGLVAEHLRISRGLPSIDIASDYHSNWLDNTRAKFELGWRPVYDTVKLIDTAYAYRRASDDPRKVWYPG
ncbi:nucleoside-diphosphate-sugar epimerase [Dongia mobilis]|uniref:Nucleoside-diphosphate-sugar epimerase n=1 Tax=Dongia mobilis TaxID=578943 RepID=A0A4R6WR78_9PROT|nr:NAD(P)-dependent oxidoreductase [Dongia mobilis]TDQ84112.1 nucleoside-diphosphate-sugar epimerase [Dongia mobilis]